MATFTGRQKQFPAIKDVDEIITEELLEAAAGMAAIVGKFIYSLDLFCCLAGDAVDKLSVFYPYLILYL